MSLPDWHEEPISKKHDRASFDCGEPELNDFLRRHARQSHDKGEAKTFLAVSNQDGAILGFYTLCRPRCSTPACLKSFEKAWPAMTCRFFGWDDWQSTAPCREKGWEGNCFWRQGGDACWRRQKLAVWRCSSMPRTSARPSGTRLTGPCPWRTRRSRCSCPW